MPALVLSKLPVCRDLLLVAAVPVGWRGDAAAPAAIGRLRRTYATASPTEQRWWEPCRADEALSSGETSFLAVQPCPNRSFSSALLVSRFMLVSAPANLLWEKLAG